MKDIPDLIDSLEKTPQILANLLKEIPAELLKKHRRKGKWSIHEHACHLAQADQMILSRFRRLSTEENPLFRSYVPGKTVPDDLLSLDLKQETEDFAISRASMVAEVRRFDMNIWEKEVEHEEYTTYSPYILLRHTLFHDHFHLYRIEELWLTRDEFLH